MRRCAASLGTEAYDKYASVLGFARLACGSFCKAVAYD